MPYIGRIRIEDAEALREAKEAEVGHEMSAYPLAAEFNAVRVGQMPTYYYYHVNHPPSAAEQLPGEYVADDYDGIPASAKPSVLETVFEVEEEGETVRKRDKQKNVPEGATVIDDDLVPHRFAGQ